jgi:hypothetical protein
MGKKDCVVFAERRAADWRSCVDSHQIRSSCCVVAAQLDLEGRVLYSEQVIKFVEMENVCLKD